MPLPRILEPEVMDSAQEALDYDQMDHAEVNRKFVEDLLAAGIDVPDRQTDVLDLGTGTAQIPIQLCRQHSLCRVMAADAAISMLETARYNVELAGLIERIQLTHVDAKALPFDSEMFDVVMSNSIVHHIPQPLVALREAVRVTRQGGLLFFRDLLRPDTEAERQRLVRAYAGTGNAYQQKMFADSLHAALTLLEVQELVTQLGFDLNSVQQTSDRHWTWIGRRTGSAA
jgi:ubiquinone/menaquinone biosynthesis C-methylase UbiE